MDKQLEPWQCVDSRVIFQHPPLTLAEDTVILPSGQQIKWLYWRDKCDFIVLVCVDEAQRVLVARQYCHPPRRIMYEFPGGRVEEGESLAHAARRELMEEVQLYPRRLEKLGSFLANNRRSANRGHVFLAADLDERALPADETEFIAYEWLAIEALEAKIRAGEMENGSLLAAWSLFRLNWEVNVDAGSSSGV